ncbi:hypothetical protein ANO14919_012570 [Xylariales sp. No.14919]|nr:hypothetical protein ANO14919_012570 [Xylariales sp. No.14919]
MGTNSAFVFVHDATLEPDEEWRERESAEEWPTHLSNTFPSARVLIFQYDTSWIDSLGAILNRVHLGNAADRLTEYIQSQEVNSNIPFVVFAHGLGGLLYEEAVSRSQQASEASRLRDTFQRRRHAAFLFGTPHFGAGIAEWAIIVAKAHGLACAETPQAQDWSRLKYEIAEISGMQRRFREVVRSSESKVKTIGCFPTLPEPKSKLILSSEWAVLPEFIPIAVNSSQSSMTKLNPSDDSFQAIVISLKSLVEQLCLRPEPVVEAGEGWFLLRRKGNIPITISDDNNGEPTGPVYIGQIIGITEGPSIIKEDTGGYPYSIPIETRPVYRFPGKPTDQGDADIHIKGRTTAASLLGSAADPKLRSAFRRIFRPFEDCERLDTYLGNITQDYVRDAVERLESKEYFQELEDEGTGVHSIYVITGIIVARDAKIAGRHSIHRDTSARAATEMSDIVGAGVQGSTSKGKEIAREGLRDYLVAVRVGKLTKGLLDRSWRGPTLQEGMIIIYDRGAG